MAWINWYAVSHYIFQENWFISETKWSVYVDIERIFTERKPLRYEEESTIAQTMLCGGRSFFCLKRVGTNIRMPINIFNPFKPFFRALQKQWTGMEGNSRNTINGSHKNIIYWPTTFYTVFFPTLAFRSRLVCASCRWAVGKPLI